MSIPSDDLQRRATISQTDGPTVPHVGMAGDTYTILLRGKDTAGRYGLIDMHVPPGGGPPLHRHDFEESFTVLEGEIEALFRGQHLTVRAGEVINIPANAPHKWKNVSDRAARLLCFCSPAGGEEFFLEVGAPVPTRTTPPPPLTPAEQQAFRAKMVALAPKYKSELLEQH